MLDVKLISMNYENVCGYLCFCCADAVDCGAEEELTWMFMDRYGLGGLYVDEYGLGGCWGIAGCIAALHGVCPALWILP